MSKVRWGRAALTLCFLLLVALLGAQLSRLSVTLSPDALTRSLRDKGELLPLAQWEVSLFRCPKGTSAVLDCAPLGEPTTLDLPAPAALEALVKDAAKQGPVPNAALVRHAFSEEERVWLGRERMVTLVVPRSVQRRVRLEAQGTVWETTGIGVSAQFPVAASELLSQREARLFFSFTELPWFGPSEQPAALVRNESVDAYVSFPLRATLAAEIPNVLLIAFPVLLVALALVLDHSTLFLSLAVYAATRAVRAALALALVDAGETVPALAWAYLALDGLVAAALLQFVVFFCQQRKRYSRGSLVVAIGFACVFLAVGALSGNLFRAVESTDLWSDVLACSLSLPFLLLSLARPPRRSSSASSPGDVADAAGADHFHARALLLVAGVGAHLWGAAADIVSLGQGGPRVSLSVTHHVLLPVLIVATLASVGSITTRMGQFATLMKGRIEKLLAGTRELAGARSTPQAFARALRIAVAEIPALHSAVFEVLVGEPGARGASRYLLSGDRAMSGEVPLFDGFVAPGAFERNAQVRVHGERGERITFPLWHGDRWKASVEARLPLGGALTREDEEFFATLLQGVAVTLENLGTLEALERADRLKDEFLANTSHELRTPLTGMIGLAEALLASGAVQGEGPRRSLSLVVSSGRRLANLVGDILDFSSLRENTLELQRKPLSVGAAIEVAVALCRPMATGKALSLSTRIAPDCPPVFADENRLQQILCNLIGNALKFTDAGEVEVEASCASQEADCVTIIVRDTGPGIPAELHEEIFKSFVQGEASLTRTHGGTGLGLAVTRKLVELQKGTLSLESKVGVGSAFAFTLPVSTEPAQQAVSAQASGTDFRTESESVGLMQRVIENPIDFRDAASGASLDTHSDPHAGSLAGATILVVDDEAVNREVLKAQLELEGVNVLLAGLGDEALALLERERIDLVLLDLMLPRRNGFDVCRAIRARHDASVLPVILLTAKNQVSDLVQAFEAGANDFLSKPFSRRELTARVKNHLQLARTRQAYARFVPNDLLRMLGKDHITELALGDQVAREMSILFLDIRGFTRLSESLSAKETFDFLNTYFKTINPVVVRNAGYIDKYIGDAVMALFPGDPCDALRAGVDLLAEVDAFNAGNVALGRPVIRIGLGAHHGKIMLGTIGSELRMEGTVISETVNLASRLEGMSKHFGVSLIASVELAGRLDDSFGWRPIGRVRAKGSTKTIPVAEVFAADPILLRSAKERMKGTFARALGLFEARAFYDARELFEEAARAAAPAADAVAAFYVRECARMQLREEAGGDAALEEAWDGTIHFEGK